MKEYSSKTSLHNTKVLVDSDDITIFNKNTTKGKFKFSDITELIWSDPSPSQKIGLIRVTAREKEYTLFFSHTQRGEFLELCNMLAHSSGIDAIPESFGDRARDTLKAFLKFILSPRTWVCLALIFYGLRSCHGLF